MIKRDWLLDVTAILTHDNCPDGSASALIASDVLPTARIVFLMHGTQAYEDLAPAPGMLFVDITPPKARAKEFVAAGAIVLDHHAKQEDVVKMFGERGIYADEKRQRGVSGAGLAYEHVWRPFMLAGEEGVMAKLDATEQAKVLTRAATRANR